MFIKQMLFSITLAGSKIFLLLQMYNPCQKSWYTYCLFYILMIWVFLRTIIKQILLSLKKFTSVSNHFTTVLQPQLVLNMFLIFHKFSGSYSYKIVRIKNECNSQNTVEKSQIEGLFIFYSLPETSDLKLPTSNTQLPNEGASAFDYFRPN